MSLPAFGFMAVIKLVCFRPLLICVLSYHLMCPAPPPTFFLDPSSEFTSRPDDTAMPVFIWVHFTF